MDLLTLDRTAVLGPCLSMSSLFEMRKSDGNAKIGHRHLRCSAYHLMSLACRFFRFVSTSCPPSNRRCRSAFRPLKSPSAGRLCLAERAATKRKASALKAANPNPLPAPSRVKTIHAWLASNLKPEPRRPAPCRCADRTSPMHGRLPSSPAANCTC
ncbi:hypothetical protein CI102_3485 [Trichoderma harzianum]|uniref:Uncharacterized protein n=1 Tax=Trichoderma harzianum CBS 226.95 TaxID=983964 RepID=A0A2T4A7U0_TRIHA|nr:hypothetical protein M431DRAFT_509478 [Trichoderma harzianum CBS 226.95]PKK51590.1 hypothetical protein CI102_3485 [Trichoderma harzianum]PTB53122.1 hypothetical protein M431DRAFT_509478 [Trichoderma harzianum CBS 226.95]